MRAFGILSLLITLAIIGYLMMSEQEASGVTANPATAKAAEQAAQRAVDRANEQLHKQDAQLTETPKE